MARYWAEGPVKTRLARSIGQDRARRIYKGLAETVWNGLVGEGVQHERFLFVEPADRAAETGEWLGAPDHLEGQSAGDLGARLQSAFQRAFSLGVDKAAVIGTDAPAVDGAVCREVFRGLDRHDVVIVPALDGGYALLALKRVVPELFVDMPWSTEHVCAETVERARRLGLQARVLDPVRDIDELSDWEAFEAECDGSGA